MLRRVMPAAAPLRFLIRRRLLATAAPSVKGAAPYVAHRSDAQERIAQVDVIEVDSDVALCDGGACGTFVVGNELLDTLSLVGGGATGHPIEFIQLNKRAGPSPTACKYCGLRFIGKGHHH